MVEQSLSPKDPDFDQEKSLQWLREHGVEVEMPADRKNASALAE
jgi:hypothetical protein